MPIFNLTTVISDQIFQFSLLDTVSQLVILFETVLDFLKNQKHNALKPYLSLKADFNL